MKTIIFLLFAISTQALGQNERIGLGVKGAFTLGLNKVQSEFVHFNIYPKPDYSAGVFYRVTKNKFYLLNELLFSSRGLKLLTDVPSTSLFHQTYIDLNVIPGIQFKKFIACAGVSGAINIKNKAVVTRPEEKFVSGYDLISKFDWGFIVLVGYRVPIKKTSLLFDLRFSQYLVNNNTAGRLKQISLGTGIIF